MNELDVQDWRRRIFELYARIRAQSSPQAAWADWRDTREQLFATHAATPLPTGGPAPALHDYDPHARLLAEVKRVAPEQLELPTGDGRSYRFTHFASAHCELGALELYWLEGYAGGLFLPFSDDSPESYHGGRYLLDTVKGADLGVAGERLVLDFNFAYNPSCSYDDRWSCPLPSNRNRLEGPVAAGELAP